MARVDRVSRRVLLCALLWLPPAAAGAQDVAAGLTEALVVGAERVVAQLGRPGGFLDDPEARVPLPGRSSRHRAPCAWPGCRVWSTTCRSA